MTRPKKVTPLELFFDLVYVFAVTEVAALLEAGPSWGDAGRGALILALMWWAWSQFTWAANAVDVEGRPSRLVLLASTLASFFLALSVPTAFGGGGLRFGTAYLAVRFLGLGLYWLGLRHDPEHQAALRTFLPLASVAPLVALAGGVASPTARPWIWAAALALEVAAAAMAGRGEFRVASGHFAERHGLFVIIALGETIVAVGVAAAGLEPSAAVLWAAGLAVAGAAALWWAYFDRAAEEWEHALERLPVEARGRLARDTYTFLHYPIVAGIVGFAVAAEHAVAHPGETLEGPTRAVLAAGIGLVLTGITAARSRAGLAAGWARAAAVAAIIAALAAGGGGWSGGLVLAGAVAALVAAVAVETVARREPAG
jgi:low temperature requirement protein LtrA